MERDYPILIPAVILNDNRLSPFDKIMFGEINVLSNRHGFCFAQNSYFAKKYNTSIRTIQRSLNALSDLMYIVVINEDNKRSIYTFLERE